MKPGKKVLIKKNHLKAQQVLQSFSLELDAQLNQVKSYSIKKLKKSQGVSLPAIKQPHKSFHSKENWKYSDIENKANQLELRINRMQRGNSSFMGGKKYKGLFTTESESSRYIPHIMPPVQYIPYPVYHFFSGFNNQGKNYPPINPNQYRNLQQSIAVSKDKKEKISQSRKAYLKRRLKVAFFCAYFIFVYKTYFKTILYKKCMNFLEVQQKISLDFIQVEADAYQELIPSNLFENFYFLTKEIENEAQSSKNLSVNFQNEELKYNIQAAQQFLRELLDSLYQTIQDGSLSSFNPLFCNFLQGGFLYSSLFLTEELEIMNLNKDYGYLMIDAQTSKMLIINFVFIKTIIFQLLGKKSLLGIIFNFYKKRPAQKKFTLFYGKKLTITLILLYQSLNRVFFSEIKKLSPNYDTMPSFVKVEPLQQLVYQLSLNQKQYKPPNKFQQNELIKNVVGPQKLRPLFLSGFEQNWNKIKKISEILYEDALAYKFEMLRDIKKQIHENPFPDRQLLKDMLKFKYERTKQFDEQAENLVYESSDDDMRTKMSKSFMDINDLEGR